MGRQRNRHQMKEQEISPEEQLNEVEASNLSGIEFKVKIIRMLNSMKKDIKINSIENIKKDQSEIKNAISEINNTMEGINSRLDEAEDQISDLEDKVEKKHPSIVAKKKK